MDGGSGLRIGLCCAVAAGGATLFGSACGDGPGVGPPQTHHLALSLCRKIVECGCGELLGQIAEPMPLDCNTWLLPVLPYGYDGYDGYDDYGYEGGGQSYDEPPITLDEACLERLADALDATDCGARSIPSRCEDYCLPYFGPGLLGSPCDHLYGCGRGLLCAAGECRDPCQLRPASEGQRCDTLDCQPGLVCTATQDFEFPVCVRPPGPGEPCDQGDCAVGSWCDTTDDVCVDQVSVGAPCSGHRQCDSLYCPAGYCELPPGPDQTCGTDGACVGDAVCIIEETSGVGTCVRAPPLCEALLFFEL